MTESRVTVLESPYSKMDGNRFLSNDDERKVHFRLYFFSPKMCFIVDEWRGVYESGQLVCLLVLGGVTYSMFADRWKMVACVTETEL